MHRPCFDAGRDAELEGIEDTQRLFGVDWRAA